MGIPRFFRYISERYPCLSEPINSNQLCEYDNLYLDMNAIPKIHSLPNSNLGFTEQDYSYSILNYLSYLFQLIKPNKVLFISFDGASPRMKINQQRAENFRRLYIKQKNDAINPVLKIVLPAEHPSDTFSTSKEDIDEQLKYFIKQKISTDKAWSKCKIVYSSYKTPGEGEHKIMDYIRYIKSQPEYDPNTRHCLYGLDADLIVLGLCTHEPNISLLREEVTFDGNESLDTAVENQTFFLFHLSMMRSYLEQEFISLKNVLSFGFDLEKIIDDWILMTFLLGNDFIPPLPNLTVNIEALPLMYETYKKVIIRLDVSTSVNKEFLLHRQDYYKERLKYKEFSQDVVIDQAKCYVKAIQWLLHYYYQGCVSWSWFYPHYFTPFITDIVNFKDVDLTYDMGYPLKHYEGLLATLPCFRNQVPDVFKFLMTSDESPISYFYPRDFDVYIPRKSDRGLIPLVPFIVLNDLLSAMKPYYEKFTETERKVNSHEPMFIYEYSIDNLGEIMSTDISPKQLKNNVRETSLEWKDLIVPPDRVVREALPNIMKNLYFPGIQTLDHIQFTTHFSSGDIRVFHLPNYSQSAILTISQNSISDTPLENLAASLLGKVIWVGWPHLNQARIVSVSTESCRYYYKPVQNNINTMEDEEVTELLKEDAKFTEVTFKWNKRIIIEHHLSRLGIDVREITTIVNAVCLKGYKYVSKTGGNLIKEAIWCTELTPYPLQTIVPKLETGAASPNQYQSIEDVMANGDKVFITDGPYYGCMSEIVDMSSLSKSGQISICVNVEQEPVITHLKRESNAPIYMPVDVAARVAGVKIFTFSLITGSLTVIREGSYKKINIGLNLKSRRKNERVLGYTCMMDDDWLYSQKSIDLVIDYYRAFPKVFRKLDFIQFQSYNGTCKLLNQLFPGNEGEAEIKAVVAWISAQPYNMYSKSSCEANSLEPDELLSIRDSVDQQRSQFLGETKLQHIHVKPSILFKSELHMGNFPPDSSAKYMLYDRVINVNSHSSVPLGMKGTVTEILHKKDSNNTVHLCDKLKYEPSYRILFDEPFLGAYDADGINAHRLFRLRGADLLNITYGRDRHQKVEKDCPH